MVKFYESRFSYDYSFPAVTLAYFLRYPNPYSTHVLSTDVIDRRFDPTTQRLHTVRLHLKRSKIPSAVLRLLPKSVLGTTNNNAGQSYILERTVVDIKEGWMATETKNLEWTGVLSVVERQLYNRPTAMDKSGLNHNIGFQEDGMGMATDPGTDVKTVVTFKSRLGQGRRLGSKKASDRQPKLSQSAENEDETTPKRGFLSSWSTTSIQRSIELIGVRRTGDHISKSTDGMKLVLERLRKGGLVAVLEGMKRDSQDPLGRDGPWKRAWRKGDEDASDTDRHVNHFLDDD